MKFKKLLSVMLAACMLAGFSACSDDDDGSSEKKKKDKDSEIVTEIVTDAEKTDEGSSSDEGGSGSGSSSSIADGSSSEESGGLPGSSDSSDSSSSSSSGTGSQEGLKTFEDMAKDYDPDHPEETVSSMLKEAFKMAFGENMKTEYDKSTSTYTIDVWQPGFAAMINTTQGAQTIDTLTPSLETALEQMTEKIRTLDPKANIVFRFVSDEDEKTPLLTIENGKTTYNITKQ